MSAHGLLALHGTPAHPPHTIYLRLFALKVGEDVAAGSEMLPDPRDHRAALVGV
jgi:hypothetical protein